MHHLFLLFTLLFLNPNTPLETKSDPNAKRLLDEISASTDAIDVIYIDFEFTLSNSSENISETSKGSLTVKNDQYILDFMGVKQISDGETIWTFLEEDEEIQISEIDTEDQDALSPSNLLKMYEKGFAYKLGKQYGNLQIIELIPENKEVDYSKIELLIDTQSKQIKSLKQFGENTTSSEYKIHSFSPILLEDKAFTVSETDFPDYDIIDLR